MKREEGISHFSHSEDQMSVGHIHIDIHGWFLDPVGMCHCYKGSGSNTGSL